MAVFVANIEGSQNCSNTLDGVDVIFASLHGSNLLEQRRSSCRGVKKDLHFDLTLNPCRAIASYWRNVQQKIQLFLPAKNHS